MLMLSGCIAVPPLGQQRCSLPELPPIPATVHLTIEPGQPSRADEGGKQLVLAYVNARAQLRQCY